MNSADILKIQGWVEDNRDKALDIYIAGQVFGGKPGEAPQSPKICKVVGDTIIIYFSETERLWIKNPENATVVGYSLFIKKATAIRWGWHHYGRPQVDLNWCEMIFQIGNKEVTLVEIEPLDWHLPINIKRSKFNGDNVIAIK